MSFNVNFPQRPNNQAAMNNMPTGGENLRDNAFSLRPDEAVLIQNYFVEGNNKLVTRKGHTLLEIITGGIAPSMIETLDNDTLVYGYNDGTDSYVSTYTISTGTSTIKKTFTGVTNDFDGVKYGEYFAIANFSSKVSLIHLTGKFLAFDNGTTEFLAGETITGAGGATGTITNMSVISGTWSGNDAAGVILLTGITGIFINNETLTASGGGSAKADGTQEDWYEIAGAPVCKKLELYNSTTGAHLFGGNISTNQSTFQWSDADPTLTAVPFFDWTAAAVPAATDGGEATFRGGGALNDMISFRDRIVILYEDASVIYRLSTINIDGTGASQNREVIEQEFNFGGFSGAGKSRDSIFYVSEKGVYKMTIGDAGKDEVNISNILGESLIDGIDFSSSDIEWDGNQRVFITCAKESSVENFILVWDDQKQLWTRITGPTFAKMTRVQSDIYALDSYLVKIYKFLDGDSDNGVDINYQATFREDNYGDPALLKATSFIHIGGKFSPSTNLKIGIHTWNESGSKTTDAIVRYTSGSGTSITSTPYGYGKRPYGKTAKDVLSEAGLVEFFADDLIASKPFTKMQIEVSTSASVPHELYFIRVESYPIRLARNRNLTLS